LHKILIKESFYKSTKFGKKKSRENAGWVLHVASENKTPNQSKIKRCTNMEMLLQKEFDSIVNRFRVSNLKWRPFRDPNNWA
jgi:hypothetical protein